MLALLAAAALPTPVHGKPIARVAAIDWAMLETAVSIGVMPIAATELIRFRQDSVEPNLPDSVADLGLRGAPNFELLHLLRPELILSSPFYARYSDQLAGIAPVVSLPFYIKGEPPFSKALNALRDLGDVLSRQTEAALAIEKTEQTLVDISRALAAFASRPSYIINIGDSRHFRAFGADSMFGNVLDRLGLPNAWTERSRFSFAAAVPLEVLADQPDARIVIVSDVPVEARSSLSDSRIWKALEPVRHGRVLQLANVNPYGGVTAGLRFARLLAAALPSQEKAL
jgi:ABC-type Fe3+-hydroxamate transport system substrate-binding protein